jgi:peptidoglycan/LPS O-acetylase OafA/YrhL
LRELRARFWIARDLHPDAEPQAVWDAVSNRPKPPPRPRRWAGLAVLGALTISPWLMFHLVKGVALDGRYLIAALAGIAAALLVANWRRLSGLGKLLGVVAVAMLALVALAAGHRHRR